MFQAGSNHRQCFPSIQALDLAGIRQFSRKIPPFMDDAQDFDFLVPVSGSRVHSVEQGVRMGGDGAKVAG